AWQSVKYKPIWVKKEDENTVGALTYAAATSQAFVIIVNKFARIGDYTYRKNENQIDKIIQIILRGAQEGTSCMRERSFNRKGQKFERLIVPNWNIQQRNFKADRFERLFREGREQLGLPIPTQIILEMTQQEREISVLEQNIVQNPNTLIEVSIIEKIRGRLLNFLDKWKELGA
ncbi:MAG: hypothetical protein EZS28_031406, partial [Streblomastix strix]